MRETNVYSKIKGLSYEAEEYLYELGLVHGKTETQGILIAFFNYRMRVEEIIKLCANFLNTACSKEQRSDVLEIQERANEMAKRIRMKA